MMPGAMQGANMTNVTVLGAGAWGTAFGQVLAEGATDEVLRDPQVIKAYLGGE